MQGRVFEQVGDEAPEVLERKCMPMPFVMSGWKIEEHPFIAYFIEQASQWPGSMGIDAIEPFEIRLHPRIRDAIPAQAFASHSPCRSILRIDSLDGQSRKRIAASLGVSLVSVNDEVKSQAIVLSHFAQGNFRKIIFEILMTAANAVRIWPESGKWGSAKIRDKALDSLQPADQAECQVNFQKNSPCLLRGEQRVRKRSELASIF